ncbi:hypothetical protein ILUMI_26698 [Ignelater luminosus]|uniref:RAP domain-containing protein n=1 Tax=Ignelater luminosus TaxID=2038154 RepID=A0A8K0C455_IGNLU|nr:hypothetical protein ILUMI_26698 [Ignelater luminosus]
MSLRIRTWIAFHKVRNNPTFCRLLSNYNSKDLTAKQIINSPTTTSGPDYLLQNLKNSTQPQNVLEVVGSHYKIMNSKQLMQALRSLFTLQKYGNSNLSTQQIIQHPYFEKLCHQLKTQAGLIELNETIEALKIISYVGVSSQSTIVQVLLQLIRHGINDLSLQHIMFLDFLLRQFKSSPLADGLLIALPIVFEVNLPLKMDKENIMHLAEYLQYVSKRSVSDKCLKLIVDTLLRYINKHDLTDPKIAKSIVWSICDMKEDEYFEPLFKKATNALILLDIEKLEYNEILTTMTKLIFKYSPQFPFYYNETLIDICANYIVDNDCGFEEAAYTLRKFLRINHTHDNLLNYVSKQCNENPELILQASPLHMYTIAAATALSEFRPVYWNILKEALINTKCFQNYTKRDVVWPKLAVSLCALDIYKLDVIEYVFNEEHANKIFRGNFVADYENFLLLYQAIATLQPDYKYLLPPTSTIEALVSKRKPVLEYPLEWSLQKGLGGESYVKTCLRTKLGHHIDHVIVMRKGGYPIALPKNLDSQYLEELEIPLDSQMIVILALNEPYYTINSNRLKATSILLIKTLEAKGFTVVPICMETWNSLADFEKIPFLMQSIRVKSEDNTHSISNVG